RFDAADVGEYQCRVFNDVGSCLCSSLPATIIDKAVSVDVTEGDPATLQCKFSGTKEITAKWFKDGKELKFGPKYKIGFTENASVLKIISAAKNDSGEYTFEVENDVGRSTCNLIIPPSFTKKLKKKDKPPKFVKKLDPSLIAKHGNSAQLECKISGSPEIRVMWYKNDTELQHSEKYNLSFAESVAILEINNISSDDNGDYTCEAHNDAGSASSSTVITAKAELNIVNCIKSIENLLLY
uniref:Ig-like domain-containing protein n=1 Tax=Leptobrachium leishanense TaxID=445787 RepID=A0A8C5R3T3_9ANUR